MMVVCSLPSTLLYIVWTRHGIYCLANIFIGYTQVLNGFCPSPITVTVQYEYRAISCIPLYIAYIRTYISIIICTKSMAVHTYEWTIQYCSSCCYALCTLWCLVFSQSECVGWYKWTLLPLQYTTYIRMYVS